MPNRLSKEKAGLIASNYCTNGYKRKEALLSAGYSNHYAGHGGMKLFDNVTVKEAIARIEANTQAETGFSVRQYQLQLDEDRDMAIACKQPSAAVSATVAKGRSCGYDKDNDISADTDTERRAKDEQLQQEIEEFNEWKRNKLHIAREGSASPKAGAKAG